MFLVSSCQARVADDAKINTLQVHPVDTRRNNNVIITSKRRCNVFLT